MASFFCFISYTSISYNAKNEILSANISKEENKCEVISGLLKTVDYMSSEYKDA